MPRRRFFISRDQIRDAGAILTPDQAHHLRHVLRLRPGSEVELFDGEGLRYLGTIEWCGPDIRVGALRQLEPAAARETNFVLAAALIKSDRFEWMLQKGTELGVDRFVPLETRFSIVHIPAARLESRLGRWQRIVMEASKQSRRPTVPTIHKPLPWSEFLGSQDYCTWTRFFLYEKAADGIPAEPLKTEQVLLCVGPEGGWDAEEAATAESAGFRPVNMGSRILRAETAALAAVAIFQFLLDQ